MKFGPTIERIPATRSSEKQLGICALFKAVVSLCRSVYMETGDTILSSQPIQNTVAYRAVDLKPTTSASISVAYDRYRLGIPPPSLINRCKLGSRVREAISRLRTIAR